MLINTNMGSKDNSSILEAPPVHCKDFPTPRNVFSPEIPAPPPPPPPIQSLSDPQRGPFPRFDPKRRSRLRNFNWEAIPLEKLKGRSSLWSSETFQGDVQIDTGTMEELFGKHEEEILHRPCNPRRSLSLGETHINKVFVLDARRSMNICILLKQFKRSAAQVVEDIRMGKAEAYSSERLTELLKHLPHREEVQRLFSFQGERERLGEADLFMLLLLDVPSYELRLESLILKKDFHPAIVSQLSAARVLKTAAEELLQCSNLHFILKLVLEAGNFMNAGGYAGNAAGFRVSSLLKLADTKANKPGMNLLHFVVMEVHKKDPKYLSFADALKHVQSASRLSEESLLEEFDKLQSRVTTMQKNLATQDQQELRRQMEEFLEHAEEQLHDVQREIQQLQITKHNLAEFLCEDEDAFRLEECCKIFSCFCQKFQMAIKENKVRELEEQRRQQWERKRLLKRHSMASCASLEAHQTMDDFELTLERNLENLCRTSSVRLCRMRSFDSHSPNPFVPKSEQRERIQVYCEQRNAEQMREMSERVLRQQVEYRNARTFIPGNKASFYPVSKLHKDSYCQSAAKADSKKSPLKDRSLELEESESNDGAVTQPVHRVNQQQPQHVSQLSVPYTPIHPDNSSAAATCPPSHVTKADIDTQTEVMEQPGVSCQPLGHAGQSKPLLEAAKLRQPSDQVITSLERPLDGTGVNRQSESQMEMESHFQMPLTPALKPTRPGLVSQCKCVTEKPCAGFENVNDFSVNELKYQNRQSKIPPYTHGLETFKPTPAHSASQNFTQFSMKSSPECSKKSLVTSNAPTVHQQGMEAWNKQRDPSNSQMPMPSPDMPREVKKSQAPHQSAVELLDLEPPSHSIPETSGLSKLHIRSDTHVQPLTSDILKTNQSPSAMDASSLSETLPQPANVSEEQQRSSASVRTFNQHKLENVQQTLAPNISSSETLTWDSSEALPHTSIHLHPESLRGDDSPRQSALKIPKQYAIKSFRQTLVKSSPKNTKQSVASAVPLLPSTSLGQSRSEACNPNQSQSKAELSRTGSKSKPGFFMSRIKHVQHLSIKQPANNTNGQVPSQPQNVVEPKNEVSKVLQSQDTDSNHHAKGPKDPHAVVQREAPNPCSKWKRELRKASENADSCKVELKVEHGNMEPDKDNMEQKTVDNLRNPSLGRSGSNISKKSKNDLETRKVFMNKDVTVGPINSLVTKQPVSTKQENTETRIPQKVSAGSAKPPSTKMMGSFKEKRESVRSNNDSGKPERKNSLVVTPRYPAASTESPGQSTEHVKEPAWPSKKTNSVARVAIHVIKHYEVTSTLTRGSRSPYLTTHPVWR